MLSVLLRRAIAQVSAGTCYKSSFAVIKDELHPDGKFRFVRTMQEAGGTLKLAANKPQPNKDQTEKCSCRK